jgi:putative SOS response-associated peptidase YedK
MCFHTKQTKTAQDLKHRFHAIFEEEELYEVKEVMNGFTYGQVPIITNKYPDKIKLFHWGLVPNWAKDNTIRQYTLNAQIETLADKPSFKNVVQNRCIVLVDGFYEWEWLDSKGKEKQKYLLHHQTHEPFAMGGLWSVRMMGELMLKTFTIATTPANELMSKIHNTKKRMPLILNDDMAYKWLQGNDTKEFVTQPEDIIEATKIDIV